MLKVFAINVALAAAAALAALPFAASAGEIPQAVKDACKGDYQQHCKAHVPESPGARDCMAAAFEQLSDPCVSAILNSDLVDEQAASAKAGAKPAANRGARVADTGRPKARHASRARRADRNRRVASAERPRVGHWKRLSGPNKVARYIDRGTRIASFYVGKALSKAFR